MFRDILVHVDGRAAATAFSEEIAGRLADSCWFSAEGNIAEGISNRARYTDLVILGQNDWQGSSEAHPLPIAHAVVLRCGRPVLTRLRLRPTSGTGDCVALAV